jgi:hypothetical protein
LTRKKQPGFPSIRACRAGAAAEVRLLALIRGQQFFLPSLRDFAKTHPHQGNLNWGMAREFLPELSSPFQASRLRRGWVNPPGLNRERQNIMRPQNLIQILIGIVCFGLLPKV